MNIHAAYITIVLAGGVMSRDEALAAVREGAEHRYDAEVLAAFDQVMEELALERVEDQEVLAEGLRPALLSGVRAAEAPSTRDIKIGDLSDAARDYTFQIVCYK